MFWKISVKLVLASKNIKQLPWKVNIYFEREWTEKFWRINRGRQLPLSASGRATVWSQGSSDQPMDKKHCQRHNGAKGWVRLTKVTYFSHITSSNTKFDQISSSDYRPSINIKILTSANNSILTKLKIQDIMTKPGIRISTKIQLHYWLPPQNISSKTLTKLQLQILPELQLQNLNQTFCLKSEQKFSFMTKPQLPNLQQTVANTILNISNSNNLNKFWVGIFICHGYINQFN